MKELLYSKCFKNPRERDWMEDLPSESRSSKLEFLRAVQEFSDDWQVDTELYQEDGQLEVHLFFRWDRSAGIFKLSLERLIRRSSAIRIPPCTRTEYKSELILIWKNDRET